MSIKILSVSNNQGGTNVVLPVVKLARARGSEVVVAAGGVGFESFTRAGLSVDIQGKTAKGLTARPDGFDRAAAAIYLERHKPDVVLLGQSSPMDWEDDFGSVANHLRIPVLTVNDFWRGAGRFKHTVPDVVCAMDGYDQKISWSRYPSASMVITGNPGVSRPDIDESLRQQFQNLRQRFQHIVLFVGSSPEVTTSELQLLLECLKYTPDIGLVARFHPKYSGQEKEPGVRWSKVWEDMLGSMGDNHIRIAPESFSTDALACLCDATCSGFSTVNTTAAYNGQAAISLWTDATKKSLKTQSELDEVPLVRLDCAHQISDPQSLIPLFVKPTQHALSHLSPYRPEDVLHTIDTLFPQI